MRGNRIYWKQWVPALAAGWAGFVLAMLAAGCAGVPFEPVELVPVAGLDPAQVRAGFAASIPEKFETQNSLVFEFWGHKMAGLGFGSVDRKERAFTVVGLTHMGMKLFEVVGKGDELKTAFALPELAERGDLATAIGRDVQRIYFDLVPSEQAEIFVRRRAIVFVDRSGSASTEYVFGGRDARLLEKRCRTDGKRESTVQFYDYREQAGRWRPFGVLLDNDRYGYRLIVRERPESKE